MSIELTILALACVFGILQIFIASELESRQHGMAWSLSSREEPTPPLRPLVGRLKRAQANFQETFPIAAAAILIIQVAGLNGTLTMIGATMWFAARVAFWGVYAVGVPVVRSILFATSIVGIGLVLWPAFAAAIRSAGSP